MGSTTSPLSSSTFTLDPTFNGSSSYSSSLQQVLTHAVQMAALPMEQMQNDVSNLTGQESTLSSLESTFAGLQSAVQNVASAAQGALTAQVSDPSVVSATATSQALPGTYTIAVDSLGSSTTTMSNQGLPTVTDPTTDNISSATSFSLSVDGQQYTINPSGTSLESLAEAINNSGADVQATIVNLGGSSSPDFRLTVTGENLGSDSIQLSAGSQNLLTTLATGAPAEYEVNGSTEELQSNSSQVTIAPGLTVSLLGQSASGQPATITVSNDFSGLESALSSFASAYNSAASAVAAQRGQNAGDLSGQGIVFTLADALNSLATYTNGTGTVNSLASLGLTLDESGQLSFDASAFSSQPTSNIQQFLGSATTGGFLQTATQSLTSVADSSTGAIVTEENLSQTQINNENSEIADQQTNIQSLENNLETQLSEADATIANLESQKTYFADLFQAEYPSTSS